MTEARDCSLLGMRLDVGEGDEMATCQPLSGFAVVKALGSDGEVRYLTAATDGLKSVECLGMAAPDMAVYEELSALENLRFFARVRGLRRIWRQTSMPDMIGSIQSSTTRSGLRSASNVRASSPSIASQTRKPSFSIL